MGKGFLLNSLVDCVLVWRAEGEAALEPVPADVKTPRAGGNALGCVASLLSVLRLMYGTYTEAPSAPPAGAAGGPGTSGGLAAGGALPGAGGGSGGKVVQSVPGVDHVADYRLAVQMWLPRDTNHNNRWGPGAKPGRAPIHLAPLRHRLATDSRGSGIQPGLCPAAACCCAAAAGGGVTGVVLTPALMGLQRPRVSRPPRGRSGSACGASIQPWSSGEGGARANCLVRSVHAALRVDAGYCAVAVRLKVA